MTWHTMRIETPSVTIASMQKNVTCVSRSLVLPIKVLYSIKSSSLALFSVSKATLMSELSCVVKLKVLICVKDSMVVIQSRSL